MQPGTDHPTPRHATHPNRDPRRADRALVIGAGFGGLSAALALAGAGYRVTVLEAGPRVGGKADSPTGEYDTGPSLLTLPDVLESVFRAAGCRLDERVTVRRLSPATQHRFSDGVVLTLGGEAEVRDALGVQAAWDYRRLLDHSRRIWEAAAPAFVYGDAPGLRQLARDPLGSLRSLAAIDGTRSLATAVASLTRSPHLRAVFNRFATYSGSDPRVAPATLLCVAWVELGLGAYGVVGGLHAVAKAMATRLAELGGEVHTGCRVERVVMERGRVAGVEAGGTHHRADVVVSNADTRHLFDTLAPRGGLRAALASRSRASVPSMSGWNAVAPGAMGVPHTVLYPETRRGESIDEAYLDEFAAIFDRRAVRRSPTVYVCDQAAAHAAAPHLFFMVNAPDAAQWREGPEAMERIEHDALDRARSHGARIDGPPMFRRSPAQLAERFSGSDGALYGAASNSRVSAFLRPPNRLPDFPGLYVASGTAHPGGGVPLAALSGLAAARAALEDARPSRAAIRSA